MERKLTTNDLQRLTNYGLLHTYQTTRSTLAGMDDDAVGLYELEDEFELILAECRRRGIDVNDYRDRITTRTLDDRQLKNFLTDSLRRIAELVNDYDDDTKDAPFCGFEELHILIKQISDVEQEFEVREMDSNDIWLTRNLF